MNLFTQGLSKHLKLNKTQERDKQNDPNTAAEAQSGLSCAAGFQTEPAFCRRLLQRTRAQANTNKSLPLQ